jgi:spore coat polysaccharide biosynthesis protein SpsF
VRNDKIMSDGNIAILQARVSSTRLYGKVLKSLIGKPMMLRQIERIKFSEKIDTLVVATSNMREDDQIEELCLKNNIECYRGSLNDVLDRFYKAAVKYNPSYVIRLTADCPLVDPRLIDQIIEYYLSGDFDYVSNSVEPTYPDGLDVEVVNFASLLKAWQEAVLYSDREHVLTYIHQRPNLFKIGHFKASQDLSHLRWTVDESKDFELVEIIYKALYPTNVNFNTDDILKLLIEKPELMSWNTIYQRNEGYQRSVENDKKS